MTKVELPLFADRHNHPYLYATLRAGVDLSEALDSEEALERIGQRLDEHPPSDAEFLLAHGWNSALGELPLDELRTDSGVVAFHRSLHQLQLNRTAVALLNKRYPEDVPRLADRQWFELNFQRILNWFAGVGLTPADLEAWYRWQQTLGIGFVEELLCCGSEELRLFAEAGLRERTRFWASPEVWRELSPVDQAEIQGFKLFLDGALGSWTAALLEPYADRPGHRGSLLYEDYDLAELIYQLAPLGKGLAIHAIGDAATAQAVRICRQLGTRLHGFSEVRIEHAQLMTTDDAQRARRLGISLCMQPNFSIDSVHYEKRLGKGRAERNNPFRMLIDDAGFQPGIDLIFGTDGMPQGATFAIEQGLLPPCSGQALTLRELADGFSGVPVSPGAIVCHWDEDRPRVEILDGETG